MTLISNDPSWWPLINFYRVSSYFAVASSIAVLYDCALTFGREVELVWKQRCSRMTVLYLSVRYIGILYSACNILSNVTSISLIDLVSTILAFVQSWTSFVINTMLGVIILVRLHAMYQQSRKMLIFLIVIFLALTIASGVIAVIQSNSLSGEEAILCGIHQCIYQVEADYQLLMDEKWALGTAWEALAVCLAAWAVVRHFRELRQSSIGWTAGDCFAALVKTHVFYFAAFAAASCLNLGYISPKLLDSISVGAQIYYGVLQIAVLMQMFVLGPRLILSIREIHAELVDNSDTGVCMTTIAFQEIQVPNGDDAYHIPAL